MTHEEKSVASYTVMVPSEGHVRRGSGQGTIGWVMAWEDVEKLTLGGKE